VADVHPTAVIEPGAVLAEDVRVGPYAVIGPEALLEAGVEIGAHAVIEGATRIGPGTRVFAHACLGGPPQDRGCDPSEATRLEIGRDNVIREHVTIHAGTPRGGGGTRIGDDNLIMNTAHIAHDCQVGSHTTIASFSGLAGHCTVGDWAVLGAYTGVHQHSRVGEGAMTASGSKLSLDAPPFAMVAGDRARLVGHNVTGMKRRAFSPETIAQIKHAYHLIFQSRLRLEEALARVGADLGGVPEVERIVEFLRKSERGFCR